MGNIKSYPYTTAMLTFNSRKAWGYAQDQMKTTHPIRGKI